MALIALFSGARGVGPATDSSVMFKSAPASAESLDLCVELDWKGFTPAAAAAADVAPLDVPNAGG